MNERVTKFNYVAGKDPLGYKTDDKEAIWKQLEDQVERVYEEAKEMLDAVQERDIVEVLDGYLDVKFTNEYVENLLKAIGVDTTGSWHTVLSNNESKSTTSFEYAEASFVEYLKQGVHVNLDAVDYEGTRYYVLKRVGDNKVMKLKDHVPPDLAKFVPDEWKE